MRDPVLRYGPNIATYILNTAPFNSTLNLKGIAAGNACWGGTATEVNCNGPNSEQNDLDMYYGKGLVSKKLYTAAYDACAPRRHEDATSLLHLPRCTLASHLPLVTCGRCAPGGTWTPSRKCSELTGEAFDSIGPHNVYFLYDTCSLDDLSAWLQRVGKSYRWLLTSLREELASNGNHTPVADLMARRPEGTERLRYPGADGGFIYGCGGEAAIRSWLHTPPVQKALHLRSSGSGFGYDRGGPASITLWYGSRRTLDCPGCSPSLLLLLRWWCALAHRPRFARAPVCCRPALSKKIRVLIYNGDADACVPYKGNEEWIDGLEKDGTLTQKKAWAPWFTGAAKGRRAPAGYVTTYTPAAT